MIKLTSFIITMVLWVITLIFGVIFIPNHFNGGLALGLIWFICFLPLPIVFIFYPPEHF